MYLVTGSAQMCYAHVIPIILLLFSKKFSFAYISGSQPLLTCNFYGGALSPTLCVTSKWCLGVGGRGIDTKGMSVCLVQQ